MYSLIVLKVLWTSLGRFERFQPWRKVLSNSFPSWVINMMNVQSEKTHYLSHPKKASQRSMEADLVRGISQRFGYNLPEKLIFPLNFSGKYHNETFIADSCDKNNKQYSACPCIQNPLRRIR